MGIPTEPPRQPWSTTGRISLGALARVYPPPIGDEILLRWERQEARRRQLPARLLVHFVIALALWSGSADREVMHKLVEGLRGLPGWPDGGELPTHAGITLARQRLGVEPLRALLDAAARPVATPRRTGRGTAPGAWSPWTTRSWTSRTARTTPPRSVGSAAAVGSEAAIRRLGWSPGWSAALTPTSTLRSARCIEAATTLSRQRLPSLQAGMLCLADRNVVGIELRKQASARADVLWRVRKGTILEPLQAFPDGSCLSCLCPSTYARWHGSHAMPHPDPSAASASGTTERPNCR